MKLYSALQYRDTLCFLYDCLQNLYKKNSKISEKNKILQKCIRIMTTIFNFVLISHSSVTSIAIIYPVYKHLVLHKKDFILPLVIPGVNKEHVIGYYMHSIVHAIIFLFGLIGIMLSDLFLATFIINSYVYVEIFKKDIDDLNTLLIDNKNDNQNLEIKKQLRLIVCNYNDILV